MCDLDVTASAHGPLNTAAEVLEALHVSGPRALISRQAIDELAAKVEAMQARVAKAEGAMARENPAVFATVQVSARERDAATGCLGGGGEHSGGGGHLALEPWR